MPISKTPSPRKLEIGMYLYIIDTELTYQINAIEKGGLLIHAVLLQTGEQTQITSKELYTLSVGYIYASSLKELENKIAKRHEVSLSPPAAAIPQNFLLRARKMLQLVKHVETRVNARESEYNELGFTNILREEVEAQGISLATYYNYCNKIRIAGGDENRLAFSLHRSTHNNLQLSKAQHHFLDTLIYDHKFEDCAEIFRIGKALLEHTKGFWIDPESCETIPQDLVAELTDVKIPIEVILENPEKRRLLKNIDYVSRSFFFKYYKGLVSQPESKAILDARYGTGYWDSIMKVFDTFISQATHPLQYVWADHYLLDAFMVDYETRSKPTRLWLTVLIDAYTRCIIGFALLTEVPCIDSIQNALYMGLWPKSFIEDWGIQGDWYGHGIPVQLFLDNALAHHSHSLENLARAIGNNGEYNTIDIVHRKPYEARQGALVERYFGNLSRKLKNRLRDKGAIQSSHPKDVRNAAKAAALLYEDLFRIILQEIVNYQNSPHAGLGGMTPNQKWEEALEGHTILVPPHTAATERLFWRMYPGTRQLTSKGISLFGLKYTSSQLAKQPHFNRSGVKIQYSIRYKMDDVSRIAVFAGDRYLCDAFATQLRLADGTYRKTSFAELEMAKSIAHSNNNIDITNSDLLRYIANTDQTFEQRVKEKKQAHKRVKNPKLSAPKKQIQIDSTSTQAASTIEVEKYDNFLSSFGKPHSKPSSN